MELVATSKMRQAVEGVLATRPYANLAWQTVLKLTQNPKRHLHPLLRVSPEKTVKKIGLVFIASNRGLCGGYNAQLVKKALVFLTNQRVPAEIFLLGRKGRQLVWRYGQTVAAEFEKLDYLDNTEEIRPLAKMVIDDFLDRKYGKIFVAYTDFVSVVKQVPRLKQLLPIQIEKKDEYLGVVGHDSRLGLDAEFLQQKQKKYLEDEKGYRYEYQFEPSAQEVLETMLPRLIEIQLYQAMLESNAAEHSARMMAMKNATDAASDMLYELLLVYNKVRQAGITREITEISAAAGAAEE